MDKPDSLTTQSASAGVSVDASIASQNRDRLLISILNWNGIEDTLTCLEQFSNGANDGFDCLVLDNGSAVDPSAAIKGRYPHTEVFRQLENCGFTGGHNFVMQLALDRGYGSVLILNNDCKIDSKSIRRMQMMLDTHTDVAAVSPLIYSDNAEQRPQVVSGWLNWEQHRSVHPSQPGVKAPAGYPTHVVGTALLLRCAALREIGLLDDRYFAYYEDNDLSARIGNSRYAAMYCDTAIAFHRHRKINECSALSFYLSTRNAWLFWRTHTPPTFRHHLARDLMSQHLMEIATLKKNRASPDKALAIIEGFWDAQCGRFGSPPNQRSSPLLLRMIALAAPYFLSQFISAPMITLRHKIKVGLRKSNASKDCQ